MTDTPTIYELMPRVMASIGAVGKTQKNKDQDFMFRGIDDAMNAVQPALVEHGVFYAPRLLSMEVEKYQTKYGTAMKNVTVTVEYTFYGPAGDDVKVVTAGEAADAGDKAVGKAQSVALKFALLHALCIPTKDMTDADAEAHERAAPVPAAPPVVVPDGWESQKEWEDAFKRLRDDTAAIEDADAKAAVVKWVKDHKITFGTLTAAVAQDWAQEIDSARPAESVLTGGGE